MIFPLLFTALGHEPAMPGYFFIVEGPDRGDSVGDDPTGAIIPTDETALDDAQRIIRELKNAGAYSDPALMMVAKSDTRRTVFAIPFNLNQPI